jgi:outer membrane protein assembly factor BamB
MSKAAGSYWGSIVMAEGRGYVTDQSGTTLVFKPNPEKLEVIAKNNLGEHSNSTPALSNGQVFIRTFKHLWCIESK